jgi:hypothetical protein
MLGDIACADLILTHFKHSYDSPGNSIMPVDAVIEFSDVEADEGRPEAKQS